jgi:hypothetical protein
VYADDPPTFTTAFGLAVVRLRLVGGRPALEWMIELGPAKVVQTFEQQYTELVALVRSQKKSENETRLQVRVRAFAL